MKFPMFQFAIVDKFYLIDYQPIEAISSNPPLTATERPRDSRGLFFCL
jgi:hypothetical protein